ncbi:MAG: esterase/lipase family protein [Pyrinomonadaceae bacterium]
MKLHYPALNSTSILVRCCRIAILLVLSISSTGCISAHRTPNLERIFAIARSRTGKRPVIVIPGILGSELINSKTGEKVWPSALRSEEDGLPMNPDLSSNTDDLVAGKIVETVRLARALPEVYVYRDLLEALRRYAGYREGDWNNPSSEGDRDSFYVFSYDWRSDNVGNARQLVTSIRRLKEKLKRPDLRFDIIAHSMGGLIARYAAMYGDNDLPADNQPLQPNWAGSADINKIVMIGVPNEGSADAFSTLLDGYSITEGLRRRIPLLNKLGAEDAIRTPSVFQLLPHETAVRFLDENLRPLKIDLYDAGEWKKYGWSIINVDEFRNKYDAAGQNKLDDYLAAQLARARQFHRALDAVSTTSTPPVTLFAIGGDCEETLDAPVIVRNSRKDSWMTLIRPQEYLTSDGVRISKKEITQAMYSPGDGRVTRASLLGEHLFADTPTSEQVKMSTTLALRYAVFGCDLHGHLQRNKTLQDNALTAIIAEAMK